VHVRGSTGGGGAQQLTLWKGCHGCTSAIQMETRRRTATHILEGKSWVHVSDSNGGQEAHGNSQSGRDVMAACQRFNLRAGSNSQSGRDVMAARQRFNQRAGAARQLTSWKGSHGRTSAIQMGPGVARQLTL